MAIPIGTIFGEVLLELRFAGFPLLPIRIEFRVRGGRVSFDRSNSSTDLR